MGETVNMHEAKTQLSRLVERVERGEEITIARNGTPVARLTPLPRAPGDGKRGLVGLMRGEIDEGTAFAPEADAEILRMFGLDED